MFLLFRKKHVLQVRGRDSRGLEALTFQCPQHWTSWSVGEQGLEGPDCGSALSVTYRWSDLGQDIQPVYEMGPLTAPALLCHIEDRTVDRKR